MLCYICMCGQSLIDCVMYKILCCYISSLFLQENCLISRFQNIRINFVIIQTTAKLSLSFKIALSFPLYTTFVYRSITHHGM